MMTATLLADVWELFSQRSLEVQRYLAFLTALTETRATKLARADSNGDPVIHDEYTLERDLVKTLRANGYLLLYNLVEATMTNAVDAIHRTVTADSVDFDDLRDELKQIVLHNFRRVLRQTDVSLIEGKLPLQRAIVALGYDKKELFSGNIDARLIRETADKYGFVVAAHDTDLTRDGARLLQVKTKRNELAHGQISFQECGQEIPHDELVAIAGETIGYLQAVLRGIEQYVDERSYVARSKDTEPKAIDAGGLSAARN